jgi:hypothetical protein
MYPLTLCLNYQIGSNVAVSDLTAMDAKYEYEYLIKFKNMSYMHVQWLSANDIGKINYSVQHHFLLYIISRRGDESKE